MLRLRFPLRMAALGCVVALTVSTSSAIAGSASLIRIEPRPFYGATVTLEEGVRVFRPLPPHSHIIINPGHRTPLNLTLEDRKETINNHNYNSASAGGGATSGGGGYAGDFGYLPNGTRLTGGRTRGGAAVGISGRAHSRGAHRGGGHRGGAAHGNHGGGKH